MGKVANAVAWVKRHKKSGRLRWIAECTLRGAGVVLALFAFVFACITNATFAKWTGTTLMTLAVFVICFLLGAILKDH